MQVIEANIMLKKYYRYIRDIKSFRSGQINNLVSSW